MKRIIIFIIPLLFCSAIVFAQDGTVLSMPEYGNDVVVRDPIRITMKTGFVGTHGNKFTACIGDGSATSTTPNNVPDGIPDAVAVIASPNMNYIKTTTFLEPVNTDPATYNRNHIAVDFQYFDGLGRPIETVSAYASPTGQDVVQLIDYDNIGRQNIKHLPFSGLNSNGNYLDRTTALTQKGTYFSSNVNNYGTDAGFSYAQTIFENSPLNRVVEQGAPGADWQPGQHAARIEYLTNTSALTSYRYTNATTAFSSITYPAQTLYITKYYDENDHETREYKNIEGQVVCKEVVTLSGTEKTLYCYDDFGLLRCVVPPRASTPSASPVWNSNSCYYYQYDERKRMIKKLIPGADWVYMVYDGRDRLVLTQDGKQRETNKWLYTRHDDLNRPIQTDSVNITQSREYLATQLESNLNYVHTNASYTTHELTHTYYDKHSDYSDLASYPFFPETGIAETSDRASSNKGRVVGQKIKVDKCFEDGDVNEFMISAIYYDQYGRIIQTVADNHLGGLDIISNKYNFRGLVEQTRYRHELDGTTHIVDQFFIYDHRNRLMRTEMKIDADPQVIVSANAYNGTGELITKYIHSRSNNPFLQKTDFRYNIRGWLKSINEPGLTDTEGDKFGMNLYYNNSLAGTIGNQYNGNISSFEWGSNANVNLHYNYGYDLKNQLLKADFNKINFRSGQFDTEYTYDEMGNILTLKRKDKKATQIDEIELAYNSSNHLVWADDDPGDAPFLPDFPGYTTYSYDKNGNMTCETGQQLTLKYNDFNLPKHIDRELTDFTTTIDFTYTHGAAKLRKRTIEEYSETITDYMGPFVYKTADSPRKLDYILMPEGRVVNTGTDLSPVWEWQYNLTDHLGNVRVVLKGDNPQSAIVCQENHYYAFGMLMADISSVDDNPYLYNGKEYNPDLDLNWYDYGARFYDPQIGRTTTQDPMMEKFYGLSPYSMFANNPLRFVDPTGMEIEEGSIKEWERQKAYTESQRNKLQTKSDGLAAKAEKKGWSADKLANKQGNLGERISSLNSSLSTMGTLESSSQVYSLSQTAPGENGGVTLNTETNAINISYGSTAGFVHETTHAGQFETGDIAFDSKSGMTLGQDIYDEVSAYKAQFAYSPSSVSGLTSTSVANSFGTITTSWVQGLAGGTLYVPRGTANTGVSPLNINSTKADFMNAYPGNAGIKSLPTDFILKSSYPNIYYKK